MNEQELHESHFPREIDFDSQFIAEVLKARAERPSGKLVREAKELGIDLTKENVWEIFLFDQLRKVEGYLMVYPDKRKVVFHTRIRTEVLQIRQDPEKNQGSSEAVLIVDEKAPLVTTDVSLGTQKITGIEKISAVPAFGHVWFESPVARFDVYHDCQHNFVTKTND
ncbi:hypothetical protein A2Z23_03475 [Candidatus Curtissbacteria bacterium RBG_16_39_7]|uniref:Uncharacterized protein n=1 Tax=Candidatus Curtissbacteria bacterium RBG_16_39_7 TaxID=1797707 RepID=A0A1F5G4R5_9BACT|nr:MAG: hypothetical protein A2Z23_03475 [Candidatus Curtissbacteria bacterium RBG_16_39_7]